MEVNNGAVDVDPGRGGVRSQGQARAVMCQEKEGGEKMRPWMGQCFGRLNCVSTDEALESHLRYLGLRRKEGRGWDKLQNNALQSSFSSATHVLQVLRLQNIYKPVGIQLLFYL